jgi:hypothetical protein
MAAERDTAPAAPAAAPAAGRSPVRGSGGAMLAALRQWRYPREFRIAPSRWPAALAQLAAPLAEPPDPPAPDLAASDLAAPDLAASDLPASDPAASDRAASDRAASDPAASARPGPGLAEVPADVAVLAPRDVAKVATELWRLRRQLGPAGSPATPEARRALRRLDAAGDVLAAAGVEVQDHDGAAYDSGQNLTVLAFEDTEGLTEERVIQTLRPTVYLAGQLAQAGEVIVGTPASTARTRQERT